MRVSACIVTFVLQGYFQVAISFPNSQRDELSGRIVGGIEATPHQFPYQVGLVVRTPGTFFCSGSLVSPNYVLTAAHCTKNAVNMTLVFGSHNMFSFEETQVRVFSTDYIVHPDWNETLLINDIALVKLEKPITENSYIKVIPLASGTDTYEGSEGVVAGWGKTTTSQQSITENLRYLNTTILNNPDCKSLLIDYKGPILPSHLCTAGNDTIENVGTCQGDSGSPLAVNGVQVGVVSFGNSDCEAGTPSVFTRITSFIDWIRANSDVEL